LRNPWRFSFDRASGALFAADVGQNDREEINIIVRGGNYGWSIMEGSLCFPPPTPTCASAGLIAPISEYSHDASGGIATIGGYVYNGPSIPDLRGAYVFGDLQSGHVWTLKLDTAGAWQRTLVLTHSLTVSSFGQDAAGEIYLLDYGNGAVLRVLAAP
jgi:glucose/arabinose dehydrogenase